MDNIFGEIIYIVIMLAILIFSALRKKKGSGGDMPQPEGETANPMDEVFSPFKGVFDDDEEKKEKEKQDSSQDIESPPTQTKYASKTEKGGRGRPFIKEDYVFTAETAPGDKRRQRINRSPGKQTDLKSEEDHSYDIPDGSAELTQWFDLRQAVIFSEILKRPDY